jgi:hypothetical protein
MSAYGACCTPASHFPKPDDRDHRRGTAFNNNQREARRPTFFSNRLRHVSALVQNPTTITFREFVAVVFFLFALYRGFSAGARTHDLLSRQDVSRVCPSMTALQCLWVHILYLFGIGYDWAAEVVPWALIAAVLVFFGEEGIKMAKGKTKR